MCAYTATGAPSRALPASSPLKTFLISVCIDGVEHHFCKLATSTTGALQSLIQSFGGADAADCPRFSVSAHPAFPAFKQGGVA